MSKPTLEQIGLLITELGKKYKARDEKLIEILSTIAQQISTEHDSLPGDLGQPLIEILDAIGKLIQQIQGGVSTGEGSLTS